MTEIEWTYDWPTEPGYYWFYGWCFGSRNHALGIHFVKVRRTGNDEIIHATDGHFLWHAEGGYDIWATAHPPMPEFDLEGQDAND